MWQSSLSDSRRSKFGWNVSGGSIEISDLGADVNSPAPLNYSVFKRQEHLGQSTISGGITSLIFELIRGPQLPLIEKICSHTNRS